MHSTKLLRIFIAALIFSFSPFCFLTSHASPDSTIIFNPASQSTTVGQDISEIAVINPGTNLVNSVTLHVVYNNALTLNSVTPSSTFSNILSATVQNPTGVTTTNNGNGTSTSIIDLGVPNGTASISSQANIATFSFHADSAINNSSILFDSNSGAAAEGEAGNVVYSTSPATITIANTSTTYTIGGTISGLANSVPVILKNGSDTVTTSTNGSFTFQNSLTDGASYAVTVNTQPAGQTCTVTNGSGTISGSNVNNILVNCTNNPVSDSQPPVLSNGTPGGILAAGTSQATVALNTNENGTCKYATSAGVSYGAMSNSFTTTGGTTHSFTASGLTNGTSYSYYVRCQDSSNNSNNSDYIISFGIDTPPSVTSSSKKSSSKDDHDKKKEDPTPNRSISNSKSTVARGAILIQRGKKFSKKSIVMLFFSKAGGGYYPPQKVMTSSSGSFAVTYRVTKPVGTYSWFAIDSKTGKKSKVRYYKVK